MKRLFRVHARGGGEWCRSRDGICLQRRGACQETGARRPRDRLAWRRRPDRPCAEAPRLDSHRPAARLLRAATLRRHVQGRHAARRRPGAPGSPARDRRPPSWLELSALGRRQRARRQGSRARVLRPEQTWPPRRRHRARHRQDRPARPRDALVSQGRPRGLVRARGHLPRPDRVRAAAPGREASRRGVRQRAGVLPAAEARSGRRDQLVVSRSTPRALSRSVLVQQDDEDDDDGEGIHGDHGKLEAEGTITDLTDSSITVQSRKASPVTCAIPRAPTSRTSSRTTASR